jgi:hypothetical protein
MYVHVYVCDTKVIKDIWRYLVSVLHVCFKIVLSYFIVSVSGSIAVLEGMHVLICRILLKYC